MREEPWGTDATYCMCRWVQRGSMDIMDIISKYCTAMHINTSLLSFLTD